MIIFKELLKNIRREILLFSIYLRYLLQISSSYFFWNNFPTKDVLKNILCNNNNVNPPQKCACCCALLNFAIMMIFLTISILFHYYSLLLFATSVNITFISFLSFMLLLYVLCFISGFQKLDSNP